MKGFFFLNKHTQQQQHTQKGNLWKKNEEDEVNEDEEDEVNEDEEDEVNEDEEDEVNEDEEDEKG